ncbi:alpha/beta fold hydrolase [Desertivirga brevis]|uniref:alpha/beta fold hydrolase n=1 Tax=Desertivirga brevis TaxID=2810310 RepID=UPI001A96811D|nr:alpha/beta hydrolase [Pedobacter sp. SYSU D00873]
MIRSASIHRRNNIRIEGNLESSRTIVFGHGFGTDQRIWGKITPAFTKDYRVILYDNVGAGKSDLDSFIPEKYRSLDAYADDLQEICSELQLSNAVFVGHSVSGMIGLITGLNVPSLFSRIVLIGASPRYLNDGSYVGGFHQAELDSLYFQMRANYVEWVSGFSKIAMRNSHNPDLSKQFEESLLSLRPDISLEVAQSIFQSDFRLILKFIESKVLIIQAQKDVAVPREVAEYMHERIKDSKLVVVNAEGHYPHVSAPEEIISAIQGFLAV